MADKRINLAALQQRDPYISEVIDNASQVALYKYNNDTESWEKTLIEGSLFVYRSFRLKTSQNAEKDEQLLALFHSSQQWFYPENLRIILEKRRSADPVYGFMILNKLGLKNLIEPITHEVEFQQQAPFLLYRNAKDIFGIWFYEKQECKRVAHRLNGYLEEVLRVVKAETGYGSMQAMADSGAEMQAGSSKSQVDIMQMLSKAQQEYNTGGATTKGTKKKTEPKPMIDNPNAAATKTSDLIRPRPLKIPEHDGGEEQDNVLLVSSTTPGTAQISLDDLFRTAVEQGGGAATLQKATSGSLQQAGTRPKNTTTTRDTKNRGAHGGAAAAGVAVHECPETDFLRRIMSTGSMVEDIEKQNVDTTPAANQGQFRLKPDDNSMPMVMPDMSQPPPNHPAYRGPSPKSHPPPHRTSPRDPGVESVDLISSTQKGVGSKSKTPQGAQPGAHAGDDSARTYDMKVDVGKFSLDSASKSGLTPESTVASDRLLPSYGNVSPSQRGASQTKYDRQSSMTERSQPRASPGREMHEATEKPPQKLSEPLLTPANLMQSASTAWSSGLAANQQKQSQSLLPSLAEVTKSLAKIELLPPSAFETKKPSADTATPEPAGGSNGHESESVSGLTKEQLKQAMLYLIKNDDDFITTLHEAYLQSFMKLSGQKP